MAVNLRHIDMNLLVALDALLEERHVSRAAEKLGLSQPAVSRMLGKMRDMFGDPLLVREKGGLVPTRRALDIMPRLKDILDQTQLMLEADEFDPTRSDRQFSIRATHYVMQTYLPRVVARFCREAPNAELIIQALDAFDLEAGRAPETDIAVVTDTTSVPETYLRKALWSDHFVCLMTADHPLARGPLTLEGYLRYRHIQVTMGGGPQSPIDMLLAGLGRSRMKAVRVPNAAVGLSMVPGTDLLITQTSRLALPMAEQLGLVWKDLPFDLAPATYHLAWHPVHHHHAAHRWFRKFIYMEIRKIFEEGAGSS